MAEKSSAWMRNQRKEFVQQVNGHLALNMSIKHWIGMNKLKHHRKGEKHLPLPLVYVWKGVLHFEQDA